MAQSTRRVVKRKYSSAPVTRFYSADNIEVGSPYGVMLPEAQPFKYAATAPVNCEVKYMRLERPFLVRAGAIETVLETGPGFPAAYTSSSLEHVVRIESLIPARVLLPIKDETIASLQTNYFAYVIYQLAQEECVATEPLTVGEVQDSFQARALVQSLALDTRGTIVLNTKVLPREHVEAIGISHVPIPTQTSILSKEIVGNAQIKPAETRLLSTILCIISRDETVTTRVLTALNIVSSLNANFAYYMLRVLTQEVLRMFTVLETTTKLVTREDVRSVSALEKVTKLLTHERITVPAVSETLVALLPQEEVKVSQAQHASASNISENVLTSQTLHITFAETKELAKPLEQELCRHSSIAESVQVVSTSETITLDIVSYSAPSQDETGPSEAQTSDYTQFAATQEMVETDLPVAASSHQTCGSTIESHLRYLAIHVTQANVNEMVETDLPVTVSSHQTRGSTIESYLRYLAIHVTQANVNEMYVRELGLYRSSSVVVETVQGS